jgi:hypothetical protein
MLSKVGIAAIAASVALPHAAFAVDVVAEGCVDVSAPKGATIAQHGKWTELTPAQWQFLRGVFVVNPNTPPGLPYGDKAVLAQLDGSSSGLVFFIDGQMACTPMVIPQALVTIVQDVAKTAVNHPGTGL